MLHWLAHLLSCTPPHAAARMLVGAVRMLTAWQRLMEWADVRRACHVQLPAVTTEVLGQRLQLRPGCSLSTGAGASQGALVFYCGG